MTHAQHLTEAAAAYRTAVDAANATLSLHTLLSDAINFPALTPEVIAGQMIVERGLTGALACCLNTQLGGNATEEQRRVAVLVMLAASEEA
jgi:hypothetical protein